MTITNASTEQAHNALNIKVERVYNVEIHLTRVTSMKFKTTSSLSSRILLISVAIMLFQGCSQQDKAISDIDQFISSADIDKSKGDWKQNLPKPPQLTFSNDKKYFWRLQTNKGEMLIELKAKESPMHVSSTIYLTTLGFYDDIVFHRVIPGFMAQGGDPLGVGVGGPGYSYMGEFESTLTHNKKGVLSMANRGAGTDGSQFFLTFTATPHLDGRHTIFGELVEGEETLENLAKFGSRSGKTKEKLLIVKALIEVK
jgi:cyclophilin family peptidyl-prolyl cis-trans isomerase